jgi:apolipoprotein N-acyltransferase
MDERNKKSTALWRLVGGLAVSAVLLTVIQAPWNVHFLAWAAWVPFILVCEPKASGKRLAAAAFVVALGYWLFNLSWLMPVTGPGYVVFAMWQALYWPVLALVTRFVRKKHWPMVVFAPVLFVGAEAIQSVLFTGFNWFFLAHSQYRILGLIQICDIFGQLAVSVLVAMVNGLIVDGILRCQTHHSLGGAFWGKTVAAVGLLAAAFGYGAWRLEQTPRYVEEGPLVGSVQPNVPSHVKERTENAPLLLEDLIEKSQACIDAGAPLVLWPETMVPETLNPGFLNYCSQDSRPLQFHRRILEHAKGQAYILFGAHAATVLDRGNKLSVTDTFNSAFLYRPDGTPDPRRYDKIHLVPFGEYIPFRTSAPWIYRLILFLSPYDYDYNLTPGQRYTVFPFRDDAGRTYRFGVLICYEDTDATVARRMTVDKNGSKRVDFLVNISNDGWYVRYRNGKVVPSAELSQRMAISVFRSIENRIALVRSVNTGISCLIDSTGCIREQYLDGTLPANPLDRQGVEGWFVDRVPIDRRITFFSVYGCWLNTVMGTTLAALVMYALWEGSKKRHKGASNDKD